MRQQSTHREDNAHKRSLEVRRVQAQNSTLGRILQLRDAIEGELLTKNIGDEFMSALNDADNVLKKLSRFF